MFPGWPVAKAVGTFALHILREFIAPQSVMRYPSAVASWSMQTPSCWRRSPNILNTVDRCSSSASTISSMLIGCCRSSLSNISASETHIRGRARRLYTVVFTAPQRYQQQRTCCRSHCTDSNQRSARSAGDCQHVRAGTARRAHLGILHSDLATEYLSVSHSLAIGDFFK